MRRSGRLYGGVLHKRREVKGRLTIEGVLLAGTVALRGVFAGTNFPSFSGIG